MEFDVEVGLGVVEDVDGRRFGFHCTRIADGTRVVRVGAAVGYEVVPGSLGRWEADQVAPLCATEGPA